MERFESIPHREDGGGGRGRMATPRPRRPGHAARGYPPPGVRDHAEAPGNPPFRFGQEFAPSQTAPSKTSPTRRRRGRTHPPTPRPLASPITSLSDHFRINHGSQPCLFSTLTARRKLDHRIHRRRCLVGLSRGPSPISL